VIELTPKSLNRLLVKSSGMLLFVKLPPSIVQVVDLVKPSEIACHVCCCRPGVSGLRRQPDSFFTIPLKARLASSSQTGDAHLVSTLCEPRAIAHRNSTALRLGSPPAQESLPGCAIERSGAPKKAPPHRKARCLRWPAASLFNSPCGRNGIWSSETSFLSRTSRLPAAAPEVSNRRHTPRNRDSKGDSSSWGCL